MEITEKDYKVMENILTSINKKCIALSESEKKRNNMLLREVVDQIISKMRKVSVLFDSIYQNNYCGGSYYDNLKVGNPDEYDLDMLLNLPGFLGAKVKASNKPGYVHLQLNNLTVEFAKRDDARKYKDLIDLMDGNKYLSTAKVLSWMESVIIQAFNVFPKEANLYKISYKIKKSEATKNVKNSQEDDWETHEVMTKLVKGGPAQTLLLEGELAGKKFKLDIDLVTCFVFSDDEWPSGYRKNPSEIRRTFFVVPKSPSKNEDTYWRLSFQEQERELISKKVKNSVLKPTIRLMKKLRDQYNHKIASYFIKTVFLWELEKSKDEFWQKSLSCVFMAMLDKYASYVEKGKIPYYWNKNLNLLANLKEETYLNIARKLRIIIQDIQANLVKDPFTVAKSLMDENEVDALREEVVIGRKYMKQSSSQPEMELVCLKNKCDKSIPAQSSFEKDPATESAVLTAIGRLEADNKKILGLCSSLMDKFKILEGKIEKISKDTEELRNQLGTTKNIPSPEIADLLGFDTLSLTCKHQDQPLN